MAKSFPAAASWLTIAMLKGDAFSCAYWPSEFARCSITNETFVEPCRAPKTVDTELSTCAHIMARDLKSKSHMLGWAIILGINVRIII